MTLTLTACQLIPARQQQAANVKEISISQQINPTNQQKSVIETVPLMNSAVKSLYEQSSQYFQNSNFNKATFNLERAYAIQPESPQISQLLAEIKLHQGDFKQAHYWAGIASQNAPSKGTICNKSWRILAIAAENLGYIAQQKQALKNQESCIVKPQNRF